MRPQIAIAPDGTATAVWQRSDGANWIIQASVRLPGGEFGDPVELSSPGGDAEYPKIAVGPDGTTTVVWFREEGSDEIVQASTRLPGGTFGTPVDLSDTGGDAEVPQVAFSAEGETAVIWTRSNGANTIIQASIRPPGGAFASSTDLTAPGQDATSPQISYAPDGSLTAVWFRLEPPNFRIQTSSRPAGGSFGVPTNLSDPGGNAVSPAIATGSDGTTAVVWRRFNGAIDVVQASTRLPGETFASPVDISAPGEYGNQPDIAFAPDGSATIIWQGSEIRAADRPPGGVFGAQVDLTSGAANLSHPTLAIAEDGTTTGIWDAYNGSHDIVQASARPPGGSFAGPVDLSLSGQDASEPAIAIDPVGSATAAWQRDDGTDAVIQTVSTLVPDFLLAVGKEGNGTGTVTSAPAGIDCGLTCAITASPFSGITLTATPDEGSRFGSWGGACEGEVEPTCELTMGQAQNVTAEFTPGKAKLKIRKVKPKKPKVRRGKRVRIKVVAGNNGDATAKGTKLCLKAGKNVKKALRPKQNCFKRGALGIGATKSATFRFKATKKARRGAFYKLKFKLTGNRTNASKASVRVRVR